MTTPKIQPRSYTNPRTKQHTYTDGPKDPAKELNRPSAQAGDPAPHYSDHASARPSHQPAVQKRSSIIPETDEQKADTRISKHDNEQKADNETKEHDNEQKLHRLSNLTAQSPSTTNHHPLAKRTRSGATYVADSAVPPSHSHKESLDRCAHRQPSARKVTFCERIEVNTEGNISFYPLIDHKPITNYFFLASVAFDMDFSCQELFFKPINSQPSFEKIHFSTDDNLE